MQPLELQALYLCIVRSYMAAAAHICRATFATSVDNQRVEAEVDSSSADHRADGRCAWERSECNEIIENPRSPSSCKSVASYAAFARVATSEPLDSVEQKSPLLVQAACCHGQTVGLCQM